MVGAKMARLLQILSVTSCAVVAGLTFGHQPHDSIGFLLISPDFMTDGSIYTAQLRADSWGHAMPVGSTDWGLTWDPLPKGVTNLSTFKCACMSPSFGTDGTMFFFTGLQGMYRTTDRGRTWQQAGSSVQAGRIYLCQAVKASDGRLIIFGAYEDGGLVVSDDLGESWRELIANSTTVIALAVSPEYATDASLVIGTSEGRVYISTDGGVSWTSCGRIATSNGINEIAIAPRFGVNGEFFVATDASGLLQTVDFGVTFSRIDAGLPNDEFTAITPSPNYANDGTLFTMTRGEGIFISSDRGHSWRPAPVALDLSNQTKKHFRCLEVSPQYDVDGTIFLGAFEGLYRSTDRGQTWNHMPTRPPLLLTGISLSPDYAADRAVAVSTYGSGLYVLRNGGTNWESANVGIENPFCYGISYAPTYGGGHDLLALHREKLLVSQDDGHTWDVQPVTLPRGLGTSHPIGALIHSESVFPTVMRPSQTYKDDGRIFIGTRHHGMRISDQIRGVWDPGRLGQLHIVSVAPSPTYFADSTIFVTTSDGDILRSVDACATWSPAMTGLPAGLSLTRLDVSPQFRTDGMVLAGTGRGLYLSQNGGETWHPAGSDPAVTRQPIEAVAFSPDYGLGNGIILTSVRGHGLYRFKEWNGTWEQVSPELLDAGLQATRIAFSPDYDRDGTVYAAAGTHIIRSTDGAMTWQVADMGFQRIEDFESRAIVFMGNWATIEAPDASAGTFALGSSPQCAVSFVFSGTGVSWIGRLDPALGTADVYLDGAFYTTVDQYNHLPIPLYSVLSITGLPAGEHEITIIESSNSGDGGLAVDAFDVYAE